MKGGGNMDNISDMIKSCNDLVLLITLRSDAIKSHDYDFAQEINRQIAFLRLKK